MYAPTFVSDDTPRWPPHGEHTPVEVDADLHTAHNRTGYAPREYTSAYGPTTTGGPTRASATATRHAVEIAAGPPRAALSRASASSARRRRRPGNPGVRLQHPDSQPTGPQHRR